MIGIVFIVGLVLGVVLTWSLFDLCNLIRNEKEWREAVRKEREEP